MAFFRAVFQNCRYSLHYVPKPVPFSSLPVMHPGDALVATAVSILKHHRSKRRWSNLRSLLISNKYLTPSQFSQIAIELRNRPHIALAFFRFTTKHSLSSHSLSSYATLIHILCRSRLRYHALTVIKSAMCSFCETPIAFLQALIKTYRACDSAPFVFDLLVEACLESKKIDSAIEIYELLKSKNVFLNASTCNSLLELVSRSRGCYAAYDLYRQIFQDCVTENGERGKGLLPNTKTMNLVMMGFYREGLVDKVEEVWQEMAGISCEPNLYSFNLLMAMYCDAGRMEDAMKVWVEVENRGLKHDVMAFNTMIGGYCKVGELSKAEEIYRNMVMKGLDSTCITFEHLINGYCKIGDSDSAMMVYEDMCRRNFIPESSIVNEIVRCLCAKNEIPAALEFWTSSMKKHEAVLKSENYKNLIKGLCEKGKMEDALELQAEMVRKGFEPDMEIYGVFIDAYTKQGNETIAEKLRKEMLLEADG
ncbi:pentatricopeptide repeat-containing protein At2g15980 [Andrographis paniculata]|uniref:pentatricopeptide repeat-containing protein At2g15980 n=1 Tax=Andrographis paniculata TaxID=175694 RepID=UPI0021E841A1|nr:pentatricopeptide repeat-containing protein At2g15980 [Andrographis paniculata]XP_051145399.1 pentatricopeptide repeat-containing protein At2g15980 [Andrographis paniculata]